MSAEVIFDKRMIERRRDTEKAADRRIRKALREGRPWSEVSLMIDAELDRSNHHIDESYRELLRHRHGRDPTDEEMDDMRRRTEKVMDRWRDDEAKA